MMTTSPMHKSALGTHLHPSQLVGLQGTISLPFQHDFEHDTGLWRLFDTRSDSHRWFFPFVTAR